MLSFTVIGILLLFVGFLSYSLNKRVGDEYSAVIKEKLEKMKLIGLLTAYSKESSTPIMILPSFAENKDKIAELGSDFSKRAQQFEEIKTQFEKLALNEIEKTTVAEVLAKWKEYVDFSFRAFEMAKNLKTGESKSGINTIVSDDVDFARIQLHETMMKFANTENEDAAIKVAEVNEQASRFTKMIALGVLVGFSLAMGFGWYFATITSKALSKITSDVASVSVQVASASGELSMAAEKLSSTAQEQASALEETSASITEMGSTVISNTKLAEQTSEVAEEVNSLTTETQRCMTDLSQAMKSIFESNDRITKLVQIIEEIGNKTEVIDEIVFKTQLLSFNASVEAERAGEHGRGFAVVAQEVGNLAQMSGSAAKEIEGIVKTSIREAEAVSKENRDRVTNGENLAHETRRRLDEVMQRMSEIIQSTGQIKVASKEQETGVGQISTSIDSLNQSAQLTASSAEEAASSSVELSSQADSLMTLVSEMQELIIGHRADVDVEVLVNEPRALVKNPQNKKVSLKRSA
jgi:methyl-accepting chemotaxis protein